MPQGKDQQKTFLRSLVVNAASDGERVMVIVINSLLLKH